MSLSEAIDLEVHPKVKAEQSSQGAKDVPTSGRYFYLDFHRGTKIGQHYSEIVAGSQNTNMRLWITTSTPLMALSGSDCTACGVHDKYDQKGSTSSKVVLENIQSDETDYFDRRTLSTVQYNGNMVKDNVKFKFNSDQDIELSIVFMSIQNTQAFHSEFDGFIGLAPYTSIQEKELSFLYQLKKNNYIDHPSFSIYTRENSRDNKSLIKFGGYDEEGLKANTHLTILRTEDAKQWGLNAEYLILGDVMLYLPGAQRIVLIEPQLPYMYLPRADFKQFTDNFVREFPNAHCSLKEGSCYFARPCDKVDTTPTALKIRLFDFKNGRFDMEWVINEMFIWGDDIGDSRDKCYAPVFLGADTNPQDRWYMGNIMVKQYYMAFDMSPLENGLGYLQVGLGYLAAADFVPKFIYEEADDNGTPDEKTDPQPNVVPDPVKPTDVPGDPGEEETGSGGAGTFFLWLIILALLGAVGFVAFKYRQKKLSEGEIGDEETEEGQYGTTLNPEDDPDLN